MYQIGCLWGEESNWEIENFIPLFQKGEHLLIWGYSYLGIFFSIVLVPFYAFRRLKE